jgi:hypothetical protein
MNLVIDYMGEKSTLNPSLVRRQGLDAERVEQLKMSHIVLRHLRAQMSAIVAAGQVGPGGGPALLPQAGGDAPAPGALVGVYRPDVARLRELAELVDQMEFCQQELWGFDSDPHFHDWTRVPGCTCTKDANNPYRRANAGILDYPRQVEGDCPIHGGADGWMPSGRPLPEGPFWVVGGEYRVADWEEIIPATIEVHGPYAAREEALATWRGLMGAKFELNQWRYRVIGRAAASLPDAGRPALEAPGAACGEI